MRRIVLLLAALAVAAPALAGCDDGVDRPADPGSDGAESIPPFMPPVTSSTEPPGAGDPAQFRVVRSAAEDPAPGVCPAEPVTVPADQPMTACEVDADSTTAYELEPASFEGGIESAEPDVSPRQTAPFVVITLDDVAAASFARVTEELAGTDRQFAVVLEGEVVTAPTVQTPITNGELQINGDFTADEASELAERLDAGG